MCGLPYRVFMLASQAHAQWHASSGSREGRASGGTRGEELLFLSCLREKRNVTLVMGVGCTAASAFGLRQVAYVHTCTLQKRGFWSSLWILALGAFPVFAFAAIVDSGVAIFLHLKWRLLPGSQLGSALVDPGLMY